MIILLKPSYNIIILKVGYIFLMLKKLYISVDEALAGAAYLSSSTHERVFLLSLLTEVW